jgi:hypothetical protein
MAWVYLSGGFALNLEGMTREQVMDALQREGFVDFEVTTRGGGGRRGSRTTMTPTPVALNPAHVVAVSDEPLR